MEFVLSVVNVIKVNAFHLFQLFFSQLSHQEKEVHAQSQIESHPTVYQHTLSEKEEDGEGEAERRRELAEEEMAQAGQPQKLEEDPDQQQDEQQEEEEEQEEGQEQPDENAVEIHHHQQQQPVRTDFQVSLCSVSSELESCLTSPRLK